MGQRQFFQHLDASRRLRGRGVDRGPTGFEHLCGISYGSDGELYGMDSISNSLVHIDTITGAGTEIGPLGRDIGNCGMTLDCLKGILYAVDGETGELFTVNRKTGAAGKR